MDKTPPDSDNGFSLRRIDAVAQSVRWLGARAFLYHRISMEGADYLPRKGTALILPKHRAYRDIILEGVQLYRATRRLATYVMKAGLYSLLEAPGGIKIIRPKDVRRIKDRDARRSLIQEAREKNQQTLDYLDWLYRRGELVISHPEGMRFQDAMGNLQKQIVEHAMHVEQVHGLRIPIIPIGLEYESFSRPLSRIFFRVGAPLYSDEYSDLSGLMGAIETRIRTLSGFDRA
jgi:1-acyl-sn-glycerol-3-phosphate acyltransferase